MPKADRSEEWRPVKGYEGIYEVSSIGRVRRVLYYRMKIGKCLIPQMTTGYHRVALSKSNTVKRFFVHRLVLIAFLGHDKTRPHCNHKNGIRADNRLANLEWSTQKENVHHSMRILKNFTFGERNGCAKLNAKQAKQVRVLYDAGETTKIIGEKFSISSTMVGYIGRRQNWKCIPE